jgi:hypothetical protein
MTDALQDRTPTTLATWVYVMHCSGVGIQDDSILVACQALDANSDNEAEAEAGRVLIERIGHLLSGSNVVSVCRSLFGDGLRDGLGEGSREERTSRIRRYQFQTDRPWLAQIWERRSSGDVASNWLLVERVTDQVAVMDPDPWDDIDEERSIPVGDFHVLWELSGCSAVHVA